MQGPPPEDAGFFPAAISNVLSTLDNPAEVIPGALFAMAALAIMLLALASLPLPARASSRTGAMLVHKRGSIALTGAGALLMAAATYFLL